MSDREGPPSSSTDATLSPPLSRNASSAAIDSLGRSQSSLSSLPPLNPDDAANALDRESIERLTHDACRKLVEYTRSELSSKFRECFQILSVAATVDDCQLLETMNKMTKEKYSNMAQMSQRLMSEMDKLQQAYGELSVFMAHVDEVHQQILQLEETAKALDEYTQYLEDKVTQNDLDICEKVLDLFLSSMTFDLGRVIRPNILALTPYRCARDDYNSGVLLDANENAYGPSLNNHNEEQALNRYPDPYQSDIKKHIVKRYGLSSPGNVFLGVGSDEIIDLIIRITCIPGKDKILTTPPTYGMYSVCAQINDIEVVKVPLNVDQGAFQLRTQAILDTISNDPNIKIIFLCSPGNPTGTCLALDDVRAILESGFQGIVAVDEAYVDFVEDNANKGSVVTWASKYPNLLVMQTLSKSFGLAGIRLGVGVADTALIQIMNNAKAPYNICTPAAKLAEEAYTEQGIARMKHHRALILAERERLVQRLESFPVPGIGRILGGNDANFVLVEILDQSGKPCNERAESIYKSMAQVHAVVVRFRGKEYGCNGCIRITVGTPTENDQFLSTLETVLS